MGKFKYYVVWEGFAPGIYESWEECRLQVENFKGAKYKSFDSKEAAIRAFRGNPEEHLFILNRVAEAIAHPELTKPRQTQTPMAPQWIVDSLAVDAAEIPEIWNIEVSTYAQDKNYSESAPCPKGPIT